MFNWATISPIKCPWIHGVKWSWTVFKNLCKTGNKTNASEITLWNWFGAYHTLAIKFLQRSSDFQISFTGIRLHVCNILDHKYFISNLPVQWLLPFFIKSNLLYFNFAWQHGLLRELNIFIFLFFQGVQCMPEFGWVFIHCKKCLMFMVWMGLIWCNSYC